MIKHRLGNSVSLWGAVLMAVLSGCGVQKEEGAVYSLVISGALGNNCHAPVAGPVAFAQTLHPQVRAKCAACHGDNPQAPFQFAQSSAALAFNDAIAVIDLGSPSQSEVVKKVQGGHNCGDSASCFSTADSFTKAIAAWADLQQPKNEKCGGKGGPNATPTPTPPSETLVVTSAIRIPATLSKTVDTTVRWDLGDSRPALQGVMLEAKLRRVDDASEASPGSFSIKFLKLATSSKGYHVAQFKVWINGAETSYLNFMAIDKVVMPLAFIKAAATYPHPVLGPQTQLVPMETAADALLFSFDLEEAASGPGTTPTPSPTPPLLTEAAQFVQDVRPILAQRCFGCHTNGTNYRMPNNDDTTLRANTLLRVNKLNPDASLLLTKGRGTNHGGGVVLNLQLEIDRIKAWIIRTP